MQCFSSERSRVRAELGLKCTIEVGSVSEAGIKRNLHHLRVFQRQACGGNSFHWSGEALEADGKNWKLDGESRS